MVQVPRSAREQAEISAESQARAEALSRTKSTWLSVPRLPGHVDDATMYFNTARPYRCPVQAALPCR